MTYYRKATLNLNKTDKVKLSQLCTALDASQSDVMRRALRLLSAVVNHPEGEVQVAIIKDNQIVERVLIL